MERVGEFVDHDEVRRAIERDPLAPFSRFILGLALVGRIETVTGGASATYGSDAMAGVVNVILDDSIEGIFDTVKQTALVQKAGGGTGFAFDMGNMMNPSRAHQNQIAFGRLKTPE